MNESGMPTDITGAMNAVLGPVGVAEIFSPPHSVGDRTVITAASVEKAGGFGFGGGSDAESNGGGGGGGGGSLQGRPVAVIEVGPTGVVVHPVFDMIRIGLVVLGALISILRPRRRRSS